MNENKVVIFTGAGISAESGIPTFRDGDGLWVKFDPEEVASAKAWREHPNRVIKFHNDLLESIEAAQPNAAHLALVELEAKYDVVVITQNGDDLHQQAGSSQVIHLHGRSTEVRSDPNDQSDPVVYTRGFKPLLPNETDEFGHRLRPNVVLFGEDMQNNSIARSHIKEAGKVLAIGTSLMVEPAASLLKKAHFHAEKMLIAKEVIESPKRFKILRGNATHLVPIVVREWLR